jgi:putative transposase
VNAKRIYRVISVYGLPLQRMQMPSRRQRRYDGMVAVPKTNQGWYSAAFEFRRDNCEPLRVTFAPDCCDREAIS